MVDKICVICGEENSEESPLRELPCWNHWVCKDDLADFFVRATDNESLYPPKCCGHMLFLDDFSEFVPEDVQIAFQLKEQGEYKILPRFRVYCAQRSCAKFLNPDGHITDPDTNISYALCEAEDCGKVTCVACKTLLEDGIEGHTCKLQEHDKKFKETAENQGYQQCYVCGRTVELTEACNHITCTCGHNFCYICGKDWPGWHGCPQYGPANYDEEGYSQEGFHRDTGLNRDGRDRFRQRRFEERGEEEDEEDENRDEEEDGDNQNENEGGPDWDVLQHIPAEQREIINAMDRDEREDTLQMLRIELMETVGIVFDQPEHGGQANADDGENNEDGEGDVNQERDDNEIGEDQGDQNIDADHEQGGIGAQDIGENEAQTEAEVRDVVQQQDLDTISGAPADHLQIHPEPTFEAELGNDEDQNHDVEMGDDRDVEPGLPGLVSLTNELEMGDAGSSESDSHDTQPITPVQSEPLDMSVPKTDTVFPDHEMVLGQATGLVEGEL